MQKLRLTLRTVFRAPDQAYACYDFEGVGGITKEAFLSNMNTKKFGIPLEDLELFIDYQNIFKGGKLNFDSFKKNFFPHLYLVQEDNHSEEDRKERA